jgi:hypothetical protein
VCGLQQQQQQQQHVSGSLEKHGALFVQNEHMLSVNMRKVPYPAQLAAAAGVIHGKVAASHCYSKPLFT